MNCSYLRNDIAKHNHLKEIPVDRTIEVLTIGTGNYNQVLHLDLSGFSKLKELTIGDYSFRKCTSFKCQGLESLVKIVIGKDCFCDMESSFFDLEDEYYMDNGDGNDDYDDYDDENDENDEYDEYGDEYDEYDDEERTYVKLNDRTYIFEAKTLLSDFYKIMKADPALFEKVEGDADTLAGLLLEIKGEFPVLHERLDYGNYHFEVLEMNTRRILKVKVIVDSSSSVEEEKK